MCVFSNIYFWVYVLFCSTFQQNLKGLALFILYLLGLYETTYFFITVILKVLVSLFGIKYDRAINNAISL